MPVSTNSHSNGGGKMLSKTLTLALGFFLIVSAPCFGADASECDTLASLKQAASDSSNLDSVTDSCLRNFDEGGECTRFERLAVLSHRSRVQRLNAAIVALESVCN